MFENVVSALLNKVLGDFVDNVQANQLNIGLWKGARYFCPEGRNAMSDPGSQVTLYWRT